METYYMGAELLQNLICLFFFFFSFHQMALLSALRQIAGISAGPLSDALKAELYTLVLGTFSLPINIPGTNYSKGLQVRFPPCMPESIRGKLS